MNSEVAQGIALVAHGNLFLQDEDTTPPELFHTNSTFESIYALKFARYALREQQQGIEVATSVAEWFTFLRTLGARRLRRHLPGIPTSMKSSGRHGSP